MQRPFSEPDSTHEALLSNWNHSWSAIGLTPSDALFNTLVSAWAEPSRHYHALQHLAECIAWFELEKDRAERPAEVAIALWFHDAIYDVHAHDNEQRSADWARDTLQAAKAPDDVTARIHALVMATRHHAVPQGRDAELLVDIDLAILGSPPARFAQYEQQIRAEYAHVPQVFFEPRRRDILQHFLDRDPLYVTPGMRAACEAQARRNLHTAIG